MSVCRNSGTKTVEPKRAKPSPKMRRFEMRKFRSLKSVRSTIGFLTVSSRTTTAMSAAAAAAVETTMNDEPNQSSSCPLSSTTWRKPKPTVRRPMPM